MELVTWDELLADDGPVETRDEMMNRAPYWETDRVLFRTRTWAVTTYGIESLMGPYHYYISKLELRPDGRGYDWPSHMAQKRWVDIVDFQKVYTRALEINGAPR